MNRNEYMAKWHGEGDEQVTNPLYVPQVWLLSVGEYADETVLGVVIGTEGEAWEKAVKLSADRLLAGEPSDMIKVSISKAEVL